MIKVSNISKKFNEVVALDNVSLEVNKGQILGLLGPNGAGKTTLVNILTTLMRPDSGSAFVKDFDVVNESSKVRSIIGLAGQFAAIDDNLTGYENLYMIARLYHLDSKESKLRTNELLKKLDLDYAKDRVAKNYSGGMRRRLDLAASLIGNPEILFMDEPTTGLDPKSRSELWGIIKDLVDDGTTLLLTTQYLEEADFLANNIVVINNGSIVAQGSPDALKKTIGEEVLEVVFASKEGVKAAEKVILDMNNTKANIDLDLMKIEVPVNGDPRYLIKVLKAIDNIDLEIKDITVRRPSLDDVFLRLTNN
ncbi:MAG: ATP-binding cassette domain-containing protein [Candidatus Dojkabacteria bacterium]|nr:ATP-binding cassette domain-containing protein [Candidatus Dojkabacteria bacterium]